MGQIAKTLLSRLGQGLLVVWGVSTLCFTLTVCLPGDLALRVALARYGEDMTDQAAVEHVRKTEGLNRPAWAQYLRWLTDVAGLRLGRSLTDGQPVIQKIAFHFANTLRLALAALGISLIMALPMGIVAGWKPGSLPDMISSALSSALVALPGFLLGAILILLVAIKLRWLPAAGFTGPEHVILPALTLALGLAAVSSRVVRTAVVEVKSALYLRFARIKGLPAKRIFWAHALRNFAAPVVTFLGLQLAHIMDGAVVVESLFDWPGIGNLLLEAIRGRDMPVIQAATLLIGQTYIVVNLAVDITCLWLDPRQRLETAQV